MTGDDDLAGKVGGYDKICYVLLALEQMLVEASGQEMPCSETGTQCNYIFPTSTSYFACHVFMSRFSKTRLIRSFISGKLNSNL